MLTSSSFVVTHCIRQAEKCRELARDRDEQRPAADRSEEERAAEETWVVFPGSRDEDADLERPSSTAECAHWRVRYSQLHAQRFPDCTRVGPTDLVHSLMLVSPVHAPLESSTDDKPPRYPLGLETRQPSQERSVETVVG